MIKKDGKEYYTLEEVDSMLSDYIKKTAQELKLELSKKQILNNKKLEHV